jgi:endonuclease/exonuclease/phosphatase family metal-dependent hydrolase
VTVLGYKYWKPDAEANSFKSRSVLFTKFLFHSDTVNLIVNHWPSRRGGVLAGEDMRVKLADMLTDKVDSLSGIVPGGAKIVVMGDFNSTPDDNEINLLTAPKKLNCPLVNLSLKKAASGEGTYRYKGTWEMIDQALVSEKLLKGEKGLCTDMEKLTIFKPGFLLTGDPQYPGNSPFSTYRGYKYQGGFSDHLPVIVELYLRNPSQQE